MAPQLEGTYKKMGLFSIIKVNMRCWTFAETAEFLRQAQMYFLMTQPENMLKF